MIKFNLTQELNEICSIYGIFSAPFSVIGAKVSAASQHIVLRLLTLNMCRVQFQVANSVYNPKKNALKQISKFLSEYNILN